MITQMTRSGFRGQAAIRGLGLAFAFLWVVPSCSLRDTGGLDSEPNGAGQPGAGETGTAGSTGAHAGEDSNAGSGGLVEGGGDTAAGGKVVHPGGGDAGAEEGGEGGAIEPPPLGTFANCPARSSWTVDSNPPVADLQAVGSTLHIAENQLLPQYAIDDADPTGTVTRFSSGRAAQGDERVTVDMGVEKWITGVYTKEVSDDYGRKLEVSVSRDNNNYTKVGMHDGANGEFGIPFAPVVARFVRLTQTGTSTNWWSLHDYKVYCTNEVVPPAGAGGAGGTGGAGGGAGSGGGAAGTAGSAGKGGAGGS
jgi:hypothetical protein